MARVTDKGNGRARKANPGGMRGRLNVEGKDPAYVYRIVNDVDDRVARMEDRDWEVVTDTEVSIGARRASLPTPEGTVRTISVGQGITGVLMRIKKDYYDEDQAAKQAEVDSVEQTMKSGGGRADYGKVTIS